MKRFLTFLLIVVSVYANLQPPSTAGTVIPPSVIEGSLSSGHYTAEQLKRVNLDLDIIRQSSFFQKTPSASPIYLGTAGGPGSIKSTTLERFMALGPHRDKLPVDNFVAVDPDMQGLKYMVNTYISQGMSPLAISLHPQDYAQLAYEKWRGASNYIANTLFNEAVTGKYNIAHGTTATVPAVENLYKGLKDRGYEIVLLMCDTSDANRSAAITHRQDKQNFYQVTPDDAVSKSLSFYDRFPLYKQYGDKVYFYWNQEYTKPSVQAAYYARGKKLEILDQKAFGDFKQQYEKARAKKPSLAAFDTIFPS